MIWFCLFEAVAGLVGGWWVVSWWTSPARKEVRAVRKEREVVEGGSSGHRSGWTTGTPGRVISTERRLTPRQRDRMLRVFRMLQQRKSLAERIRTEDRPAMRRLARARAHVGRVGPDMDADCARPLRRPEVPCGDDCDVGHCAVCTAHIDPASTSGLCRQCLSRPDSPVEYLHDRNGVAVEARWKTGVKVVTGPLSSPPPLTDRTPQVDALKLASGDLGGLCDEHGALLAPDVLRETIGWPKGEEALFARRWRADKEEAGR